MSLPEHLNPLPGVPPWGILATVAWMLFSFLASIIAATLAYATWQGERVSPGAYDGVVIAIGALSSFPIQVAVLALAARMRRWTASDYLALVVPRRGEVVFGLLIAIALIVVFNVIMLISGRDIVPEFQVEAYRSAKNAGWLITLLFAIVIVAPAGEEIAFRGFLYRGLVRQGNERLAILVIALAWALLHIQYDLLGMVQIFAAGLVLGWFRWASGSTVLTIIMHVLINAEAMVETAIKVEWMS
jgi:membrane protease YdiL (CAAX protease family)